MRLLLFFLRGFGGFLPFLLHQFLYAGTSPGMEVTEQCFDLMRKAMVYKDFPEIIHSKDKVFKNLIIRCSITVLRYKSIIG